LRIIKRKNSAKVRCSWQFSCREPLADSLHVASTQQDFPTAGILALLVAALFAALLAILLSAAAVLIILVLLAALLVLLSSLLAGFLLFLLTRTLLALVTILVVGHGESPIGVGVDSTSGHKHRSVLK
jgi:hypothetical protein